jgi:glutamate formiminotransferase/formiminotetrahydrofolate cyclodeaminase
MTRTEGNEPGWVDRSLAEFARAAAAQGPVPGSGSVAAAVGALGAGLASMALGSVRGESHRAESASELARLMEGLLARVDGDAQAYASYLEARAGRGELAPAIEGSIAVPCEVAEHALAALERLADGAAAVRARLASEVLTASQALLACVEGATFTARSNLPGLDEPRLRDERRRELSALCARARELARTIQDRVQDLAR